MADRREHVAEIIDPALAEGKIVITDRYYYSSVAYQGALGLDPDRILAQNEVLAVRPDLTVILTLPVAQALARLSGTPQRARQVSEDPAYLERVATIYAGLQGPHLRHLDASAPAPGGSRRPAEPDPGIPGDRRARVSADRGLLARGLSNCRGLKPSNCGCRRHKGSPSFPAFRAADLLDKSISRG